MRKNDMRYYKLRHANFSTLSVGDLLISIAGFETTVVYKSPKLAVVVFPDGSEKSVTPTELQQSYRLRPLCWVETEPVYSGDTLYSKDTKVKLQVTSYIEGEVSFIGTLDTFKPESLTWLGPGMFPKPLKDPPPANIKCYVTCPAAPELHYVIRWNGTSNDVMLLNRGLLHLHPESAITHAKVQLELGKS